VSHTDEVATMMKVPQMPDNFCAQHNAVFSRIEGKLDDILRRIGSGDTQFATLELRLKAVEEKAKWLAGVVFGIGSLFSLAVIGALIKLVVLDGK
jgi:hypothetical protein